MHDIRPRSLLARASWPRTNLCARAGAAQIKRCGWNSEKNPYALLLASAEAGVSDNYQTQQNQAVFLGPIADLHNNCGVACRRVLRVKYTQKMKLRVHKLGALSCLLSIASS